MPSFNPCRKNDANGYIFYICLVSQANGVVFQAAPTLAAGDFQVSLDGGALVNLGTLPAVTPAASKMVKVTLSQAETNADNVTVVASDAAGAEWNDFYINIQTSARNFDDLAFPATTGRSMVVDAAGLVDANAVKLGPTGTGTAQTARDVGASVLLSSGVGTGQISLAAGLVTLAGVTHTGAVIPTVTTTTTATNLTTNNDKTGYSIAAGGIGAGAHAAAELNAVADGVLDRNMATGTDSGTDSTAVRTTRQALRLLRNKAAIAAGVLTCRKEDDTTASWTAAITTTAGNPISTVDPT